MSETAERTGAVAPSPPQWSPDKQWWWDGQSWIPAAQVQVQAPPPPPATTLGYGAVATRDSAPETNIMEVHPTVTPGNALSIKRMRSYWVLTSRRLITKEKGLLTGHEESIPIRRVRDVQGDQGPIAGWVTLKTELGDHRIGPLNRDDTTRLTEAITNLVVANQNLEQNIHMDTTAR